MSQSQKQGGVPVRIVSYKPLERESNLRGFVTLEIGKPGACLTVYDARYIKQGAQAGFVAPPQIASEQNGERKYFPILKWPRAWGDSILAALEDYLANQTGQLYGGGGDF